MKSPMGSGVASSIFSISSRSKKSISLIVMRVSSFVRTSLTLLGGESWLWGVPRLRGWKVSCGCGVCLAYAVGGELWLGCVGCGLWGVGCGLWGVGYGLWQVGLVGVVGMVGGAGRSDVVGGVDLKVGSWLVGKEWSRSLTCGMLSSGSP